MKRLLIAAVLAIGAAGCGSTQTVRIPSSGLLQRNGQIVLSALGAQRIGLETAPTLPVPEQRRKIVTVNHGVTGATYVRVPIRAGQPKVVIPYSAVIYDQSGATYAFTNIAPLRYVETPITVATISGNSAYLSAGPAAGSKVVSVGAEELYGVQTGVLAQT